MHKIDLFVALKFRNDGRRIGGGQMFNHLGRLHVRKLIE